MTVIPTTMKREQTNALDLKVYYDVCPILQMSRVVSYVGKPKKSHLQEPLSLHCLLLRPRYDKTIKVEGRAIPSMLAVLVGAQSLLGDSMSMKG
jgi:hypothetical protein